MKLFAFLLLFFVSVNSWAQKSLKHADKYFSEHEYYSAIDFYKKAYTEAKKANEKARILFQVAECYRHINQLSEAAVYYSKAVMAEYKDPMTFFWLAELKKTQGQYDDAIGFYLRYKKEITHFNERPYIESCELAKKWIHDPKPYDIVCLPFNTVNSDFAPAFSDESYKALYFSVFTMDPRIDDGPYQTDIFQVELASDGQWKSYSRLPETLNTAGNEGNATLTKNRRTLYFTRCGIEKSKNLHCKLFSAEKVGDTWTQVQALPFCSDENQYRQPAISAGGDTLFFSSNMPGGLGKFDLWMCIRNKSTGEFSLPINLGPNVNTSENEGYPYINEVGSTLYFSSDGHLGMGGLDLFRCSRSGESWLKAENLQYPMNSAFDDFAIIYQGALDKGYFTSNRAGCKGDDNIYSFELKK